MIIFWELATAFPPLKDRRPSPSQRARKACSSTRPILVRPWLLTASSCRKAVTPASKLLSSSTQVAPRASSPPPLSRWHDGLAGCTFHPPPSGRGRRFGNSRKSAPHASLQRLVIQKVNHQTPARARGFSADC